jgi:opacity protein-like surface antigen
VLIQPYAGIGIAMRSFERPASAGVQKLSASAVPGAEVGLGVTAWPAASFSLGFNLAYQTALGFVIEEQPPFALPNRVHARSERVALEIAPSWRVGTAVRVGVAIGGTMRTLWPEAHMLMTPGYSLIGPHARLELQVRVTDALTLRVAPEGQWITLIDESLRATGVSPQGVAVGGEAGIHYALSSHWQAGVSYRESHASIATNRGSQFQDVERYLTVRGTGSF